MKKKWFVIAFVIMILIIVIIILKAKNKSPITLVNTKSTQHNYLDISWHDEEVGQIYTVYWSDKSGINIHLPRTYHSKQEVSSALSTSNHYFRLHTKREYVYFVISKNKGKCKTKEFKAKVQLDKSFCLENLDMRTLRKNDQIVLEVDVLQDAELYNLYYYPNHGKNLIQKYNVKGMKKTMIKIDSQKEAMIYLSYSKNEKESEQVFLMYVEKFSPKAIKWHTQIKSY